MGIWADFVSLLFPECCRACGASLLKNEELVCAECRLALPYTNCHLDGENFVARQFWGKIPLQYALAYLKFTKGGRVQQLVHALKYEGEQEVGLLLGRWYGHALLAAGFAQRFDLLVPVPLHPSKLRKRGYNQAECFARGLAEALQVECRPQLLRRTTATLTQTKKNRTERWQNVEGIFALDAPQEVEGRRVLLADDVITTGATLEACALPLLQGGCASVSVAAIAAAVR